MLGWPNETVAVNEELMAEIEQATKLRAYQRGLAKEPPSAEKQNAYSERAAQIVAEELKLAEAERQREARVDKITIAEG